jgi:hypothetical protein
MLLACVFLGGCAVADFTPYSGAQQNWPVGNGAFVDNKYAVPVFYGAPNRPYVVLGYLNAETAPVRSRRGAVIAFMARRAQELGGNGLIVLGTNREYVGAVSSSLVTGNVYGGSSGDPGGCFPLAIDRKLGPTRRYLHRGRPVFDFSIRRRRNARRAVTTMGRRSQENRSLPVCGPPANA